MANAPRPAFAGPIAALFRPPGIVLAGHGLQISHSLERRSVRSHQPLLTFEARALRSQWLCGDAGSGLLRRSALLGSAQRGLAVPGAAPAGDRPARSTGGAEDAPPVTLVSAEEAARAAPARQSTAPKKSLGQNWLIDKNIALKIVQALRLPLQYHPESRNAAPRVVEIGPGRGALTALIAGEYPPPEHRITAIELDQRWIGELRERFPAVDVRHMDVLKASWAEIAEVPEGGPEQRLDVIGNLPYNITSEILFSLIGGSEYIRQAVIMMQLEVAQRLVAETRTKSYGILSVMTQLYSVRPQIVIKVPPTSFRPMPAVNSAVVRLQFPPRGEGAAGHALVPPRPRTPPRAWRAGRGRAGGGGTTHGEVKRVVRTAFQQRRKTMRNSLASVVEETGRELPAEWAIRRPEELQPLEFVRLARYFFDETPFDLAAPSA
eukprot:tig00000144_g9094.t1